MPKKSKEKIKKQKDKLKAWGWAAEKVDKLAMDTDEETIASMKDLHGMTDEQYRGGSVR